MLFVKCLVKFKSMVGLHMHKIRMAPPQPHFEAYPEPGLFLMNRNRGQFISYGFKNGSDAMRG